MESPSKQLKSELHASVQEAFSTRRPLLTHLNADTTWLLSLPYPKTPQSPRTRLFYHILIDPWLRGGQSDVAWFFSQQWHAVESSVQTIPEIEDVIRGIEDTAWAELESRTQTPQDNRRKSASGKKELEEWINAVVVSHEFTDHMHKDTLLEIPTTIPVFATLKAASIIRSWKHFSSVYDIPRFGIDWQCSSHDPLPKFIGISRVSYAGADLLYYHSAVMIAFSNGGKRGEEAEAVIYTPHGISLRDLAPVAQARPSIRTLALLHGLHDISLPRAQLNKGAHNGLQVQRLLNAKYWVGTHDEVKNGGGIVNWFLNRKIITLKEAFEREAFENGKTSEIANIDDIYFQELANGESLILE